MVISHISDDERSKFLVNIAANYVMAHYELPENTRQDLESMIIRRCIILNVLFSFSRL